VLISSTADKYVFDLPALSLVSYYITYMLHIQPRCFFMATGGGTHRSELQVCGLEYVVLVAEWHIISTISPKFLMHNFV
jgi:hypothetical protein